MTVPARLLLCVLAGLALVACSIEGAPDGGPDLLQRPDAGDADGGAVACDDDAGASDAGGPEVDGGARGEDGGTSASCHACHGDATHASPFADTAGTSTPPSAVWARIGPTSSTR